MLFRKNRRFTMVQMYTHAEKMRILKATARRVTATKKSSREFLQRAGILDEHGELTPMYQ